MSWPDELLLSFLSDLKEAQINGRNLITEKYGRMMQSTAPEKYEQLKKDMDSMQKRYDKTKQEYDKTKQEYDKTKQDNERLKQESLDKDAEILRLKMENEHLKQNRD